MSKLRLLNYKDFVKGFIVAVLTAILGGVYSLVNTGVLPTTEEQWYTIGLAGIGAGISYLLKNFITSSDGKVLGIKTS